MRVRERERERARERERGGSLALHKHDVLHVEVSDPRKQRLFLSVIVM